MKKIFAAYIELTKPRILQLVLITTALGFFLGGRGITSYARLFFLLVGAGAVCAGAAVLNHYLERDADAKMLRTQNRPLPAGVISPANALSFGISLILLGVFLLWWKTNLLTSFLSLLTAFLYVLVYTPLKRMSWLNTTIGAIPGALPPVGGWTAATNDISGGAWILFLIMFAWQHPHFYSIAWMFREDYARGGFKILPAIHPDGKSTFQQILIFSLLLIPVSFLPTYYGLTGYWYVGGAFLLGLMLLKDSLLLAKNKNFASAKNLLKASIIYLPALLVLIIADKHF